MNSNDIANTFNQVTASAVKPLEGVLSRLVGGIVMGVILAMVVGLLLKAIGVNGKTAGSIAGFVFIITFAIRLLH